MGTVWLFLRLVAFSFADTVKINKQKLHLDWMSIAPKRKSSTWHLQQVDVFLLHYLSKKEDFSPQPLSRRDFYNPANEKPLLFKLPFSPMNSLFMTAPRNSPFPLQKKVPLLCSLDLGMGCH